MKPFSIRTALKHGTSLVLDHMGFLTIASLIQISAFIASLIPIIGLTFYAATKNIQAAKTVQIVSRYGGRIIKTITPQLRLEHVSASEATAIVIVFIMSLLLILVVLVLLRIGYLRIVLNLHDHGKARLRDLFSQWRLIGPMLAAGFLYWSMVLLGTILFIIPGIYLVITFRFYSTILVDKRCGPITALKESRIMAEGIRWDLFRWVFIAWLVAIIVMRCFLVGTFFIIPSLFAANVDIYRTLMRK